jgi:hypothetical protein
MHFTAYLKIMLLCGSEICAADFKIQKKFNRKKRVDKFRLCVNASSGDDRKYSGERSIVGKKW